MKKIAIYSAVMVLSLISCSKEMTDLKNPAVDCAEESTRTIRFVADCLTKTSISEDGAVNWIEGDQISIYYVNPSNVAVERKAVAKVYEGGAAVFEAEIPSQDAPDHYYASYPAGKGTLLPASGDFSEEFSLSFGSSDGSFRSANYMAAYCSSDKMKFDFKNAGAIIRVQIHDGGRISRGDKSMVLSGVFVESHSGPAILSATKLPVIVADGGVSGFGEPSGTVGESAKAENLTSEALSGSYIYVPVLPCDLKSGFIVGFEVKSGDNLPVFQSGAAVTSIKRSHIITVPDALERIVWDYYVSPDGTGDGMSADSPMNLEAMVAKFTAAKESTGERRTINGTVFHLEGGKTFDASKVITFDLEDCGDLNFTVQGGWKNADKAVLDGALTQKFINIASNSSVSFRDIIFYRGQDHDGGNGGAVYAKAGLLDFRNCDFISNSAGTKLGGAMYITSAADIRARDCRFIDNSCTGNSGGAISITSSSKGLYYFSNCIFNRNSSGTYYGCAIHAAKATGFLGINNCLFYENNGSKKGTTDGPSNLNIAVPHCIINSTIISPAATYGNVMGLRCGAVDSFGSSLLVNNIIVNENEASGSYVPYAMSTVNTSYWIRSAGYNQYNNFNDNDHIRVSEYDNLVGYPSLGNKPTLYSYTWDEKSCSWAWDASSKIGDMPDMETLLNLIQNDIVDGAKTSVNANANNFISWLIQQKYNNGSDDALTVDLYGTHRDEDAVWPGCYQNDNQ